MLIYQLLVVFLFLGKASGEDDDGSGDSLSSLPEITKTLSPSCNGYTDLMSDITAIPDGFINIEYQESRKEVVELFLNQAEREIPSVAMETLTIEFPQSPEYWVQYISFGHDENVELNLTLTTSQECTNQTNGNPATIERTNTLSEYAKSGDHTVDLVIGTDPKVCLSKIVINTQRPSIVSESTTFNAATGVFGCSIQPGDTTISSCVVDDLLTDLGMYGRVYVEWSPTTHAAYTVRPLADGLILHQYMYPTVIIGPFEGYMKIEAVTVAGNIYSANITTDSTSDVTLKETSPTFLNVTFDPLVTTSMVLVKPLLLDAGDAYHPYYNFTLELWGCLSGAISTTPAVTTTTTADTTTTTAEVTTATTTVSTPTTTSTATTTVTTPAQNIVTYANSAVSAAGTPTTPVVTTTTTADTTTTTAEVTSATTTVSTPTTTSTATTTVTTPAPNIATYANSVVSAVGATTDTATVSTDTTTGFIDTTTYYTDTTTKPTYITAESANTTTKSTDTTSDPATDTTSGPTSDTSFTSTTDTTMKHTTTSSAVTAVSSTVAPPNGSCCMIICQGNDILTKKEVDEKVKEIIETLTVPKGNISALRRKKISAEDNRPSAVAVGGLGIALMVLWGSSIVIMDVDHIIVAYNFLRSCIAK